MQLIPEGPNIPEALLNAHADGTVVFFCGAGVSLDAGYPLFGGLVDQLESRNPITSTPELQEAIDRGDYDFALSIIQRKLAKNAVKLRHDTADILSRKPKTLKNHTSILRLSRLRDGTCRLITTNFDRLFIKAAKKLGSVNVDSAPRLPVPKTDRWDSILHLHGLLPDNPSNLELGNLVLTSADFGEAYVTDSYCSRFVVELLRNFTVVFIGYSLNDRIMRYLLDAISYSEKFFDETANSGHFKKPYAFVEHNENDKEEVIRRWDLKEVTPIPYFVEEEFRRNRGSHYRLYDSLNAWAELASGGQNARVTLALNEATKPFLPEDIFGQERLLWALRDEKGKAAEALATVETREQTASVDWLPFFAKNRLLDQVYSPRDLQALSAQHQPDAEKALERRYLGSVTNGNGVSRLKPVSANLLKWMQWHLDRVELVDWVLENGAVPHPEFSWEYNRPQKTPTRSSLSEDQKRLWDILTSDAYAQSQMPASHWFGLRENLNLAERFYAIEFLTHITPKLAIKPSLFRGSGGHSETYFGEFEFELKLHNHEMDYQVGEIINNPALQVGLENLCEQLSQLIKSGLDWLSLVDKVSHEQDLSGYSIPSISPHAQNEFVDGFGQLVFLLRVAFDRRLAVDADRANAMADFWAQQNYPLFKRLFLYAANECGATQDRSAFNLLLEGGARWLWALDTTREVNVYLRERVRHWNARDVSRLCGAILKGPKRERYRDMSGREWRALRDRLITKYLSKLEQGGVKFPQTVVSRFSTLKQRFPYSPPEDQSDEFVIYSGPTRYAEWDEGGEPAPLPEFMQMTAGERVERWKPDQSHMLQKLALADPSAALDTLEEGLARNLEDEDLWSEGISGLARAAENAQPSAAEAQMIDEEASRANIPADYMARMLTILAKLPEKSLQSRKVANAIVEFWRKSSSTFIATDRYLELWDRVWAASAKDPSEERDIKDPVGYAINDPAGKLTEEILKDLWPKDAKVGGGIPQELADRLKKVIGRTDHSIVDASSVIVASRTEILHAVAPEFTKVNVLPLLRWETNPNAASYWSAFLWPARISPDLFKLIEADCSTALRTPDRFEERAYETLCQIYLLASMEFKATSKQAVRNILDQIGEKGLEHMSSFLRHRMLNSKEDAASYWLQTVKPWVETHWPRDAAKQTKKTMENFAMVSVYSNASFPKALNWLEDNGLLGQTPTASTILFSLKKRERDTHEDFKDSSTLPERFPKEVLHLLWLTRPFQWDHGYASEILGRVAAVDPTLIETAEYQALTEII
ncbi:MULTISPECIES: SIR2 family protein [unclassified Mesorhizobium]|uniref:SIR2 family protein n=1 Tax=unclassified Mesorhizobium TaxID=325217 RepID=UPI001651476C|nr:MULTISPECIES: SIR2 family protein [unclassified Mesorhizobium]